MRPIFSSSSSNVAAALNFVARELSVRPQETSLNRKALTGGKSKKIKDYASSEVTAQGSML